MLQELEYQELKDLGLDPWGEGFVEDIPNNHRLDGAKTL